MKRIIINIDDNITTEEYAVKLVHQVISDGKISSDGESYCFATMFYDEARTAVYADILPTGTHKFVVHSTLPW